MDMSFKRDEEKVNYKVISTNDAEGWIYLYANEGDREEPDTFQILVKRIRDKLNGKIIDHGDFSYSIDKDPCRLIYQWDSCFGITIIYPRDMEKEQALSFLEEFL